MAKKMKVLDWVAISLLLAGGLNWGLVGFFNYNLVDMLLGTWAKLVYDLVGLTTLYSVYSLWFKK